MNCPDRVALAAHLEEANEGTARACLEAHLEACEPCRRNLAHLRACAAGVAAAPVRDYDREFTRQTLARAAGTRRRGLRVLVAPLFATGAVAAALAVLWVRPGGDGDKGDMSVLQARGSGEALSSARLVGVRILRHSASGEPLPVREGDEVSPADGYSFVLINHSERPWNVMLLGVDSRRDVHWFYPGYADPKSNPGSIVVPAHPAVQPLPEGVTLSEVAEGPLSLLALFSSSALSVHEVEAALAQGGMDGLEKRWPGLLVQRVTATVR